MNTLKTFFLLILIFLLSACSPPSQVVSQNISNDADNFKVDRRIVVTNLITDKHLLEVEGKCSITNEVEKKQFVFLCRVGEDVYVKNYAVYTDGANMITTIEQLVTTNVVGYHYKLNFYPSEIIPTIVNG